MRNLNQFKKKSFCRSRIARFGTDQSGTTAIEYALIAGGIMVAVVLAIFGVGGGPVVSQWTSIADAFTQLMGG